MLTKLSQSILRDLDNTSDKHDNVIFYEQHTDIIRVELIYPDEDANCNTAKSPCHYRAENGKFALVDVVHNHSIELINTNMSSWEWRVLMRRHTPI